MRQSKHSLELGEGKSATLTSLTLTYDVTKPATNPLPMTSLTNDVIKPATLNVSPLTASNFNIKIKYENQTMYFKQQQIKLNINT